MYFPYFKARRYDYYAICQIPDAVYATGKVVPILDPITAEIKRLKSICEKGFPFVFVMNPYEYEAKEPFANLTAEFLGKNKNAILGFNVNSDTSSASVKSFLTTNPSHEKALIFHDENTDAAVIKEITSRAKSIRWLIFIDKHVRAVYTGNFPGMAHVWVEDCFKKKAKNSAYPSSSEFSNMCNQYKAKGYAGFGDFMIMSYNSADGGSAPFCVTLHLSESTKKGIIINHFLSDTNDTQKDTGGKYGEARQKLVDHLDANPPVDITDGAQLFRDSVDYQGLGAAKQMSLMHHVELISTII
jgi:hypothetical protein